MPWLHCSFVLNYHQIHTLSLGVFMKGSRQSKARRSPPPFPSLDWSAVEECAWGTWRTVGKSPLCSSRSSAISCFQYLGTARICGLCRCFPTFLGGSENVMKATGLLWCCKPIIPGLENRRTCAFVEASRWFVRLHRRRTVNSNRKAAWSNPK